MSAVSQAVSDVAELFAVAWQRWSRVSLESIGSPEAGFAEPPAELVELLVRERVEVARWLGAALAGPVDEASWEKSPQAFLRRELSRWLWRKNQFFDLDAAESAALEAEIGAALVRARELLASELPEADIAAGVHTLLGELRELLIGLLGANPRDVIASEYSPALELQILGVAPETLLDPILDVGCGRSAMLVRLLRGHGHVALGIDRDAPSDVANVADWLSFDFGRERWGSVLSHLGFSLHFLHHHLKGDDKAAVHALAFMRILHSLKIGGTFAYAPALPFIEGLLPKTEYAVDSGALPRELRVDALERAELATSLALGTATRIRRVAGR